MKRTALRLLLRAGIILAAYAIAHLVGLRDYTSVISGTSPTGAAPTYWPLAAALLYIGLHFASVVLVPILALAAAGLWLLDRRQAANRPEP